MMDVLLAIGGFVLAVLVVVGSIVATAIAFKRRPKRSAQKKKGDEKLLSRLAKTKEWNIWPSIFVLVGTAVLVFGIIPEMLPSVWEWWRHESDFFWASLAGLGVAAVVFSVSHGWLGKIVGLVALAVIAFGVWSKKPELSDVITQESAASQPQNEYLKVDGEDIVPIVHSVELDRGETVRLAYPTRHELAYTLPSNVRKRIMSGEPGACIRFRAPNGEGHLSAKEIAERDIEFRADRPVTVLFYFSPPWHWSCATDADGDPSYAL